MEKMSSNLEQDMMVEKGLNASIKEMRESGTMEADANRRGPNAARREECADLTLDIRDVC